MPFFEYKCDDCDELFTLLQKRDAPREGHACPECGGTKTARVFSVFAAQTAQPSKVPAGACCQGGSCPYSAN